MMKKMNGNLNDAAGMAVRCITHLDMEVKLLEEYIRVIQIVYENVGWQKTDVLDSDELLIAVAERSNAVSIQRYELKVEISQFLDVPTQQATIRNLARHLDVEAQQQIEHRRAKIVELEATIRQQNQTNSLLIRQTMDLYQRIATELSGTRNAPPTYSPQGELNTNDASKLLKADC